jgi:hypothetical protein
VIPVKYYPKLAIRDVGKGGFIECLGPSRSSTSVVVSVKNYT